MHILPWVLKMKYIGDENDDEQEDSQEKGLNLMDKTFFVSGARIYYSIWEVDGNPFCFFQKFSCFLFDLAFIAPTIDSFSFPIEKTGVEKFQDHLPLACKDSVAILFMFDLTSRCTLNKWVLILSIPISPFQLTMKMNYCNIAYCLPLPLQNLGNILIQMGVFILLLQYHKLVSRSQEMESGIHFHCFCSMFQDLSPYV